MRPVITDVPWIACLSVCAGYVCWTSCAKTAELIEIPFWVVDSGGPTEPSIRRIPPGGDAVWGVRPLPRCVLSSKIL